MSEEFLCYLWANRLIDSSLESTRGDAVEVVFPGERNSDAGPDFLNARIRVGGTLWVGNVEVHLNSGDWFRHNHHHDKAYNNVILHVVLNDEGEFQEFVDLGIPTLTLEGCYPPELLEKFDSMISSPAWLPCGDQILSVDPFIFNQWAPPLVIERLSEKSDQWRNLFEANKFDWEETFYQGMARCFGLKVNALPFELLSKSLPLKVIQKHQHNLFQLEALNFGQAGMLEHKFEEEYPNQLCREFSFLRGKYSLKPIDGSLWKFLRLRPPSFPTIRIAQWSLQLQRQGRLFNLLQDRISLTELKKTLTIKASDYWDSHYMFDKLSISKPKVLGESTIDLLILNFVAPFLFFYGEEKDNQSFKEYALALIEGTHAEENDTIKRWKRFGMPTENALQTQALLQLKNHYCDRKRCLQCRIGARLLNGEMVKW